MTHGRTIRNDIKRTTYLCQKEWPEDARLQYGEKGLVIKGAEAYTTAFFEVFYKDEFVRGEGRDAQDAEAQAFELLKKRLSCDHTYKPWSRKPSTGICTLCGKLHPLLYASPYHCEVCGQEHVCFQIGNLHYCLKHYCEATITNSSEYLQDVYRKAQEITRYGLTHGVFDGISDENDIFRKDEEYSDIFYHFVGVISEVIVSIRLNKKFGGDALEASMVSLDKALDDIRQDIYAISARKIKGENISEQEIQALCVAATLSFDGHLLNYSQSE